MSHVDHWKKQCLHVVFNVVFKKPSCHPVDCKKLSCLMLLSLKFPFHMSFRPQHGHVALSS